MSSAECGRSEASNGKPGSAKLLEQCRNAAETWLAAAKANSRWRGKDKEDFLRQSEGLGIKTDG